MQKNFKPHPNSFKNTFCILHEVLPEKIEGLKYRFNGRLEVPSLLLEPISVDKSNLESTIVADGIYTMQEILSFTEVKN